MKLAARKRLGAQHRRQQICNAEGGRQDCHSNEAMKCQGTKANRKGRRGKTPRPRRINQPQLSDEARGPGNDIETMSDHVSEYKNDSKINTDQHRRWQGP